jgi:hypothetical protein
MACPIPVMRVTLNLHLSSHQRARPPLRYRQDVTRAAVDRRRNVDKGAPMTIVLSSPAAKGARREALHEQDGMRVPRCLARNTREASETRPPPLRADVRSSHDVRGRKTLDVCVGPDALNPATEGRETSISRKRCETPRKRLRACVTGPLKGAAAPERLSALRSLASARGENKQTSEEVRPREKDDARVLALPPPLTS